MIPMRREHIKEYIRYLFIVLSIREKKKISKNDIRRISLRGLIIRTFCLSYLFWYLTEHTNTCSLNVE